MFIKNKVKNEVTQAISIFYRELLAVRYIFLGLGHSFRARSIILQEKVMLRA
jgi:hypothetical protein